jgi:hypothetical protein
MRETSMKKNFPRTCVAPSGDFIYGIHKPEFTAVNLRENDYVVSLGHSSSQEEIDNSSNFPPANLHVDSSPWVFEIPNAFPFMGATFVLKKQADHMVGRCNPFKAGEHDAVEPTSSKQCEGLDNQRIDCLPRAALLVLAKTSSDPEVLLQLAELSCRFEHDEENARLSGICYEKKEDGQLRPLVVDRSLFYLVSNNPHLPDSYKRQMVLLPGVQGHSPIVGEYTDGETHIWEYLRENSYIPWGHYAANMAHDA